MPLGQQLRLLELLHAPERTRNVHRALKNFSTSKWKPWHLWHSGSCGFKWFQVEASVVVLSAFLVDSPNKSFFFPHLSGNGSKITGKPVTSNNCTSHRQIEFSWTAPSPKHCKGWTKIKHLSIPVDIFQLFPTCSTGESPAACATAAAACPAASSISIWLRLAAAAAAAAAWEQTNRGFSLRCSIALLLFYVSFLEGQEESLAQRFINFHLHRGYKNHQILKLGTHSNPKIVQEKDCKRHQTVPSLDFLVALPALAACSAGDKPSARAAAAAAKPARTASKKRQKDSKVKS